MATRRGRFHSAGSDPYKSTHGKVFVKLTIRRLLFVAAVGAIGGACASGSGWDRYLRDGQHLDLVMTYEADSAGRDAEDALYVAGLSYASPASPVHDLEAARRLFQRLVDLHPESELRVVVDPILALYEDVDRKIDEAEILRIERDSALAEVERLRADVERM